MRSFETLLAVLLALGLPTPNLQSGEQFKKAAEEAKTNRTMPAGQAYDRALSEFFERQTEPVMERCLDEIPDPDTAPFEMVFQVGQSGDVLEGMVRPETNVGICFRDALRTRRFPSPPAPKYWVRMEMRLAP